MSFSEQFSHRIFDLYIQIPTNSICKAIRESLKNEFKERDFTLIFERGLRSGQYFIYLCFRFDALKGDLIEEARAALNAVGFFRCPINTC